jgi:hypothetical protein
VFPDPNPGQRLLLERNQPALVSSMGVKTTGVAITLVANHWSIRRASVGTLMPEKRLRNKDQTVLEI